jgi:hypothetical protein
MREILGPPESIVGGVPVVREKYSYISSRPLADEVAEFFLETVLIVWVRSQTENAELWRRLRKGLAISTRWSQSIVVWQVRRISERFA